MKNITIQDAGGAISVTIGGKGLLLNKQQIGIVEIIGSDTLRIDMAGIANSIFLKASEVVNPVVADAVGLKNTIQGMLVTASGDGNGDCACATLIQQTNDRIDNVITVVAESNVKADVSNDHLTNIYNNSNTLAQVITDNDAAKMQLMQQANDGITYVTNAIGETNLKADATYEVLTNIHNNGVTLNQAMTDNSAASLQMMQQTYESTNNVVSQVAENNAKTRTSNELLVNIQTNGSTLNQVVTDANTASLQRLDSLLSETVNVTNNTSVNGTKLDSIIQSTAGTTTGIQDTNQLLADNHTTTMQSLAGLKTELVSVKTTVSTGNDQLSLINQGNASIIANGATGNQSLASLDGKVGTNGFLGNVSRKLKTVTLQPTISTTAYAAGQVLGGVMTLTGALRAAILSGTWMGIQVVEKSTQKAPMDIVLFTQSPTGANFTDHAAAVWTLDYDKIIAITNIVAANYSTLSTSCGVCLGNLNKRVLSTTGNLYAVAIVNGTPTYASTSHLFFTFYFEQD